VHATYLASVNNKYVVESSLLFQLTAAPLIRTM
jgi:hypothetical protein